MTSKSNFQRTADWLAACGKYPKIASHEWGVGFSTEPNEKGLSCQIGVDLEETCEFLDCISIESTTGISSMALQEVSAILKAIGHNLKKGHAKAVIHDRVAALDALCDREVTGNGVAYMASMKKEEADRRVLNSNDSKFNEDGTPVILEGGKISKSEHYAPPYLDDLV